MAVRLPVRSAAAVTERAVINPSIFNTPPHYLYYTYPVEQTEPIMTLVEVDDRTWEQEIELAALPTLVMF